jgi:3-oxoacyl-[acyl-carrier protein] reductase
MDLDLRERTALVTGASIGIGNAVALTLAAEGVRLAVVARRAPLLEALSETIVAAGGAKPEIVAADLMEVGAPERMREQAERTLGRIDILVNCAGGSRPLPVDAGEAEWEEGMTLNFTRLRQLSHAVLPGMVARRWGRIINITGKSEPKRLNAANAAKAAVHMWAKGLSLEVARSGVTINSIAPGYILSEQIGRRIPPAERDRLAREVIPVGEIGNTTDIATLVAFLASPVSRYITGTVIPVDGGLRRYAF